MKLEGKSLPNIFSILNYELWKLGDSFLITRFVDNILWNFYLS